MLDNKFCEFLEYEITNRLSDGFWCDGVLLPSNENDYPKSKVNNERQIIMTAFIGRDGQDEYKLVLLFGPKALSRYARDLALEESVSDIDPDHLSKKIIVQLP